MKRKATVLLTLLACALVAPLAAAEPTTLQCLSAYERSVTLRQQHALGAALAQLLNCAAPSCPDDVRKECAVRVDEVNALIPTIVFEAKDAAGDDLSAVRVSMDGERLVERLDGTSLAIEPGERSFLFEVEGWPGVVKRFVIREGEKGRRERVVLAPPPSAALPAPMLAIDPTPVEAPAAAPETQGGDGPDRILLTVGILAVGVGAAALGAALGQQIHAQDRFEDSERAAGSSEASRRDDTHQLYQQAERAQISAIILGSVGVLALSSGVYLLLSSPSEAAPRKFARPKLAPWLTHAGAGVDYARAF